ncbi:DegT/DnrJ/EryC1/StrS family aminotransferase [Trueperella pecoris]|uniref:DegT/DnrJ/EryC1/StrS family aminotransferase n=1 Tax=Trueperella pecoris TaxID=2733571 RepID=A0A7M1R3F8_9ACTO|nr:DegT/DnrJ/EryC1/StrS family aminotransferase [Trueperella pecoris]QOR48789.1 DegT/DnrJ/EryC1/StrS family aminotransferase [Trueperella pecoris]
MERAMIPAAKPIVGDEERAAVDAVLASGMLAQGAEVASFEEEFSAQLTPGAQVVAVNSGTSALHIGLLASGIGEGDEVIVPSFTFAATGNSVALTGATPVFADIEPDFFCLDPDSIRASITEHTKGIMPVHLYGHPANMTEIRKIADEFGLQIFEDAAQAHGASLHGEMVGTFGSFAGFSLYPTKNMTSGEGGMISTKDPEIARRARLLRNQGMEVQYQNELVGLNNRMTNIHAAIGRVQLRKLEGWTKTRQENAAFLNTHLEGVVTPPVAEGAVHVYHQYTIRVPEDRDGFVTALREEYKVGCGVYYPIPNHRLPSLAHYAPGLELPNTEAAAKQVISLPVHPSLTQEDLERIVEAVNAVAKAGA